MTISEERLRDLIDNAHGCACAHGFHERKVRVGKRVGILVGYECRNSEVYPVVSKMKKDGTSHPSARYWGYALSEVKAIE